ncbi:hypothetical protein TRICHSKD4_2280 [Roseibium sp. TrichSKD4]|uniref:helix-turn-helix domain-containing protein n=1 Tax=Roseibium sp. TrichSKD4 TaxID=744980 RepID=UPI0001E56941|nr:helix-turn-helix domain-containing protein [Roseibium sp. TrichSKD4]EFO32481.1 hypothetical protein TRICHSKD4_2280 [Roseibium sp. TrichSKD4]
MQETVSMNAYRSVRDERDELECRVQELEAILKANFSFPTDWKLGSLQADLLRHLISCNVASFDSISSIVCSAADDVPCERAIRSLIGLLRKRLAPLGIRIKNNRGVGWWLSDADKAKIRSLSSK